MTVYTKPAVRPAWAEDATGSDIADPGNSFIQGGWPSSATPPSRETFNWLLNYAANAVRYFMQFGISAYDAAETYSIGSLAVGPDGLLYSSLVNSNTGNTPASSPSDWGAPQAFTPAGTSNDHSIATTAFVHGNYVEIGGSFSLLGGSIGNGQVPQSAVTQYQGALAIGWAQITGTKNADQLNGLVSNTGAVASTIAARDSSGQLTVGRIITTSSNGENPAASQVLVTNGTDNLSRKIAIANLLEQMILSGAVTIQADPGGTPANGTAGTLVFYY